VPNVSFATRRVSLRISSSSSSSAAHRPAHARRARERGRRPLCVALAHRGPIARDVVVGTRRKPDITLSRTLLGWEPKIALREGLVSTFEYFRELTPIG